MPPALRKLAAASACARSDSLMAPSFSSHGFCASSARAPVVAAAAPPLLLPLLLLPSPPHTGRETFSV